MESRLRLILFLLAVRFKDSGSITFGTDEPLTLSKTEKPEGLDAIAMGLRCTLVLLLDRDLTKESLSDS